MMCVQLALILDTGSGEFIYSGLISLQSAVKHLLPRMDKATPCLTASSL